MMLPTGAGGYGTSPFDGEGLPSQRTVVVEEGVLRSYLLNSYTARKLGMRSTHNASRGLAGTPGIGCGNLYLEPGTLSADAIIRDIAAGLYVTSLMGFGHQHRDRRLLAWRYRSVDRERQVDARRGRGDDCRQPGGDADERDIHWQRSRVSRLGCLAYAAHRRDDGGRGVRRAASSL